ncbi:hypothetical protein Tco_1284215 [Tanacetum coccineum]
MEELTAVVMLMARIQPADGNAETVPSYDAKAVSEVNASSKVHEQLAKKAFKERENRYLEDIVDLDEKLSSHDRIIYKIGQSIQTIHMLGKKPNKVYDPFLKAGGKLKIDSLDSGETLEDAEESRLKMRNKMVQINYGKLNALYETFVPQQEFSVEQTYFSIPSTSNNGYESKEVTSDLPIPKMPKESKLLKMFDIMGVPINGLRTRIDKTLLEDRQRRWMSDNHNSLREFYKTDVIPMSASLSKNLKELKEELIEEKNELLKDELEKSSSDSKDIQANLLKRIKILENDFKRSQAQSIDFEHKLQHQKEKMACNVSWKSKLSTLNDENVLLKTQTQNQKEVDELTEHVNQKTYAYADVRAQNQDLLMIISELRKCLKETEKGKESCNKKCVESSNSAKRPKFKDTKSKNRVLKNTMIRALSAICVESSDSAKRPKSKDTKSKNRVLKNTNDKSLSAYVRKMSSSVSIDSNNKDVFLLSHKKCVARYALSRSSSVKRALFTTPVAAKSKNLEATSVVAKSRLSVAKTTTATNKVIQLVLWIVDSGCSKHITGNLQLLRNFVEKFMVTVRFGNDHFAVITGYGDYVQGNLKICYVYYVEGLGHN